MRVWRASLPLRSSQFLLGRSSRPGEDSQHFLFLHDDEVFAINLDFGAGILAEQDAVAVVNGQREGLALIVGAAFAGGDDFALLRLVFCRVGNDDAATSCRCLFHATDQNAVMEW